MKNLLALAAAVVAAEVCIAADLAPAKLAPTVVTATRFEERADDKPVNVTVITGEQIRSSTARTVPDVLSEQAGVFIHDFFGNNAATTTIDMRGFGVTGAQNTLILVDGRRVVDIDLSGVHWSSIPLGAIERIEVMRGGGSVLYGEGATAGVINIITKSPAARGKQVTLRGSAGSFDTREAAIDASYFQGIAGANLFASHLQSDGYRRNNQNRQTNVLADFRVLADFGELALKLAHDNQGIRLPGARQVQPSVLRNDLEQDRRGTFTPLDWAQREGTQALFDWRRTFGPVEVNLGAGWRAKEQRSYFDFAGFPDYRDIMLDVWSLTPRVKISQPVFGLANSVVIGFDGYYWDYDRKRSNAQANIAHPFNIVTATQETAGFYLFDNLRVSERLSFSAGARRERLHIKANDQFDPTAPGGAFGSGAPGGSQRLYQNAHELGVRFDATANVALLAKTARSYRFANVDEIYETGPAFTNQFQFLKPQTARTQEASVELRRGRVNARLTGFQIDVDDEIHLDVFSTGIGNTNLPPSRRRGGELELNARPIDALSLAATYSYVDAKFREGVLPGGPFTQPNVQIGGKTVPLVPRHKANLRAAWQITQATQLIAAASYVSSQFMDNDEPNAFGVKIPSYTVVDLKLIHRSGPWTLTALVNNLFAEKYYNYAVRSQFVADRYNAYPLPERNGLLTVEYAFK